MNMINRLFTLRSDREVQPASDIVVQNDFSDITPYRPVSTTTHADVAEFFHLPYKPTPMDTRRTKETNNLDRRIVGVGIVVGLLATGATYIMTRLDTSQEKYVDTVAECVSARVGYKVDLKTHPEHGHTMATAALVDAVKDCEK